jgi:hypothetical protein
MTLHELYYVLNWWWSSVEGVFYWLATLFP